MEEKLNRLFQQWQRLGGAVLVLHTETATGEPPAAEALIADSTRYCRHSGRLTWVVLDWLLKNKASVNVPALLRATNAMGDGAVLGLLANAAHAQTLDTVFEAIMAGCTPNVEQDFFFVRIKNSRLASRLTMESPLPIFMKWNFWCNELRYLNRPANG